MFRPATLKDIPAVADIYEKILVQEQRHLMQIGWLPGVYPVKDTAVSALERQDLFVYEEEGAVLASAIINQSQVDVYANGDWSYEADDEKIMVLHTLVVAPEAGKRGIGKRFVEYYEQYALDHGCQVLRMDTNEKNAVARAFYRKLGYREAGIVPCVFNGIPDVHLVLLEKRIGAENRPDLE